MILVISMFMSPLGPEWCKFYLRQLLPVSTVKHELSIRPRPHPHMPQVSLLQSDRRAAVVLLISGWLVSASLPHRCCWTGGYTSDSHWPSRHERFLSSGRVNVPFLSSDMCRETKHLSLFKSDWSSSFHSETLSCRLLWFHPQTFFFHLRTPFALWTRCRQMPAPWSRYDESAAILSCSWMPWEASWSEPASRWANQGGENI